jgi:hypothetical protein
MLRTTPGWVCLALAVSVSFVASACTDSTGPRVPANAVRFSPPAQYAVWWRIVEQCSGRTGDLSRVSWYRTPEGRLLDDAGVSVAGRASRGSNPFIVLDSGYVHFGAVVRHEMLHILLDQPGHPAPFFLDVCGGIVTCDSGCAIEVHPSTTDSIVDESRLVVTGRIERTPISRSTDSGFVSVVINVRNPTGSAVWVRTTSTGRFLDRWWYQADDVGAQVDLDPRDSLVAFMPGQTRRRVLDGWISPAATTSSPRLLATGFFSAHADSSTFTINP